MASCAWGGDQRLLAMSREWLAARREELRDSWLRCENGLKYVERSSEIAVKSNNGLLHVERSRNLSCYT
jgi:hypothetical protein